MKIQKHIETILREQIRRGIAPDINSKILSMTDLTSLDGRDNEQSIKELCIKARGYKNSVDGVPSVAAVCVYPVFASIVKENLKDTGIKTACVAGAFPSGQSPLSLRIEEVKFAIEGGAEEIDMVINRGRLIAGDKDFIREEVKTIKEVCGPDIHLKVILETGELENEHLIREAARLVMESGADFIKTSTGKFTPAATLEAFYYMLDEIRKFNLMRNKMVGIKAAGGISDSETAIEYYHLVDAVLGEKWLHKRYFRFGASRLAEDIRKKIRKNLK